MRDKGYFKFRYILFMSFAFVVVLALAVDPDIASFFNLQFGAYTLVLFLGLGMTLLMAGMLHLAYRGNFDYMDDEKIVRKIVESDDLLAIATLKKGQYTYALAIAVAMLAGAIVIKF